MKNNYSRVFGKVGHSGLRWLPLFGALMFAAFFTVKPVSGQLVEAQIGNGTTGSSTSGPIYQSGTAAMDSRIVIYYTEEELADAGVFPGSTISRLSWYKNNDARLRLNAQSHLHIWQRSGMRTEDYATTVRVLEYTDTLAGGWQRIGMTIFDSATNNWPTGPEWVDFDVVPFVYTGGSLEFYIRSAIMQDVVVPTTKAIQWRNQSLGSNYRVLYTGTGNTTDSTRTFTRNASRANIKMFFVRPANTARVASVVEPLSFCPGVHDVKVEVQNNGSNIIDSMEVHWTLDGVLQTPVRVSTSIDVLGSASGNTLPVTLVSGMNFAADTQIYIKAWHAMTNGIPVVVDPADTMQATLRPGLSGTYTVGGSSPDFPDLITAADVMSRYGICGPVDLVVRAGVYEGQFVLDNVRGADMDNTITIRSETGVASDVRLTMAQVLSSTNNYLLCIRNTSYVTVRQISLEYLGSNTINASLVQLWDTASNITFDSCRFSSRMISSTSNSTAMIYARSGTIVSTNYVGGALRFTNNQFLGGATPIYLYGATNQLIDVVIEDNVVDTAGGQGFYLYYVKNAKIRNNRIRLSPSSTSSTQYGIYLYYAYEGTEVSGNIINVPGGTANNAAAYGLYSYYTYGDASQNCIVKNNAIVAGGSATGRSYGIYATNSSYQQIYNNSVVLNGGDRRSTPAYFVYTNSSYAYNKVWNNVFANLNGGVGAQLFAGAQSFETEFDFNNIYTTGDSLIVNSSATNPAANTYLRTLAEWRLQTGHGRNTLSYRPAFSDLQDLRPDAADSASWALNGRGIQIPGNGRDMEGNVRSERVEDGVPDLGAYEFTPSSVPPRASASPDTIAQGTVQLFTFAQDTVARITWNSASVPATVDVRQYTGTVPPSWNSIDSMYFYVDVDAAGGPYDYDLQVYYKDPWVGNLKSEASIQLAGSDGTVWQYYPAPQTAVDTFRNIITTTALTGAAIYSGTGISCNGAPSAPAIVTPVINMPQCPGGVYTLVAADPDLASGITYQWQQAPSGAGPWVNVPGNGTSLSYTTDPVQSAMYFRIVSTCNAASLSQASTPYEIPVLPAAQLIDWQDGSRCGPGAVILSAEGSPGSVLYWYDKPSGGVLLDTGTTFTTLPIAADTVFYVAASSTERQERVPSPAPGMEYLANDRGRGLSFTLNNIVTINSVDVYPRNSSNSNARIQILITSQDLQDTIHAGPVHRFSATPTPALQVVPVNVQLPPGNYRMVMLDSGINGAVRNLVQGASTFPYPYTSPSNAVAITNAHGGTTNTNVVGYNFFYNWSVSVPCESPRQAVQAVLGTSPEFFVRATPAICSGGLAELAVGSDRSDYDSVSWAPLTGLFTDPQGTQPYTGGNTYTVYARSAVAGQNRFIATADNSFTGCGNIDTAETFVQPDYGTATAGSSDICMNGSTILRLDHIGNYAPGTLQWQSSTDGVSYADIPGASGQTYSSPVLHETTYFRVNVRNSEGDNCVYVPVVVTVNNAEVMDSESAMICGNGAVTLSAESSSGATIKWYSSPSGGSVLDTGRSFVTPVLNTTTVFYAAASSGKAANHIGRKELSTTPMTSTTGAGIIFDAYQQFTLESVYIYPVGTGSGTVTVELRNASNTVLDSQRVTITATPEGRKTLLPLNMQVNPGSALRLVLKSVSGGVSSLQWERVAPASTSVNFPMTLSGTLSILNSTNSNVTYKYYSYFYDWNVSVGCESPRTPVTATVLAPPPISVTAARDAICLGDTVTVSVSSDNAGYSYEWIPGGVTGNATDVSPLVTTVYRVRAVDSSGGINDGCAVSDSLTVRVIPLPDARLIVAGSSTICEGDSVLLWASTGAGYRYEWLKDEQRVNGAVSSILAAREGGAYRVQISDSNGCTGLSDAQQIAELPAPDPVIYPSGDELATGTYRTYQWYLNGVRIPGAAAQQYNPQSDGSYTVEVTDESGCTGMSQPFSYTLGVVGTAARSSSVRVYPNPAVSDVHIEASVPVDVTMTGVDGRVILHQKDAEKINIATLPDAVYLILVRNKAGHLLQQVRLVKGMR